MTPTLTGAGIPGSGALPFGRSLFSLPDRRPAAVSFEFFPPRDAAATTQLWRAIRRLAPLNPAFVSVTYGAGGSTRTQTHATIARIMAETRLCPAAHLTCVAASRSEVDAIARRYWALGVRHIVALRGDRPEGTVHPHPAGYPHATSLVAGLKRLADFRITVACYPEVHPETADMTAELDILKRKQDAGADEAISQFFFDPALFLRFRDQAAAAGLTLPLIPGILPVTNFAAVRRFASLCGTSIPDWLAHLFTRLEAEPETRRMVAAMVAGEQCRVLRQAGVDRFHFFTLNRADLTYAICHLPGLRAGPERP